MIFHFYNGRACETVCEIFRACDTIDTDHSETEGMKTMLTYEEKKYLLQLLKQKKRKSLFHKQPPLHDALIEKLEQMIRNEDVNLK